MQLRLSFLKWDLEANHLVREISFGFCVAWSCAVWARTPKPAFQYQSGDIRVSLPTADEPRVKAFGPESIRAAVKYLDDGAVSWVNSLYRGNYHYITYIATTESLKALDLCGELPAISPP